MANGQGTFDYNGVGPDEPDLWADASVIVVCKYDEKKDFPKCYTAIPNVECYSVTTREGLGPAVAKLAYILDDTAVEPIWPTQYEQVFALLEYAAKGKTRDAAMRAAYTIKPDDRIVVMHFKDAEDETDFDILFDGYAESPEFNFDSQSQRVIFEASGVSIRLWDDPLYFRVERDAADPKNAGNGTRAKVHGPVKFNPGGKGNCTLTDDDAWLEVQSDESENKYPIFVDPACYGRSPKDAQKWTLAEFACYLMGYFNREEKYVENPDFEITRKLLKSRKPKDDGEFFDPTNADSYDESDIDLVEYDATNKRWPEALYSQLEACGFAGKIVSEKGEDNKPVNRIEIYRKDGTGLGNPLEVYHPRAREDLDPDACNAASISVTRTYKESYNAVLVNTANSLWEVSIVLAPGFTPQAGDEQVAALKNFLKSSFQSADQTNRDKYRLYVGDEAGDGHWEQSSSSWVDDRPLDLSELFADEDEGEEKDKDDDGDRNYCRRRRIPKGTLISKDLAGKPLKARLDFSRDYGGKTPSLWDGTGLWQPITQGWSLCDDRIGIRVTCENPEEWSIGAYEGPNQQEDSKKLAGVTSQANPTDKVKRFYLRLTCVIESDKRPVGVIDPRKSSALLYPRTIFVGSKEHFAVKKVRRNSAYNSSDSIDAIDQDDEEKIRAYGDQVQQAHENPQIAGVVTIPSIDLTYQQIGEAITMIKGRSLSFQINSGTEQGEAPRYPTIVGVTYEFQGKQATVLQLSDHRADPR